MAIMKDIKMRSRRNVARYSANTTKGYELLKANTERMSKEISGDRKAAIKFLVGTGMYNEDGTLKEEFR